MPLNVKSVCIGMMNTNCYLLTDEKTKLRAVVDPGEYGSELIQMLSENGVTKLEYIFLTHGHFDHILGVKSLKEKFGGKIVIHKQDEECFTDAILSLTDIFMVTASLPERADITVEDGDTLELGESVITVLHTPGHTKGGVCYVSEKILFSGDTLFESSIGRSDFPGGDMFVLLQSVARIADLEGDYIVYPGHAAETTLEKERCNNPYIIRRKKHY